MSQERKLCDQRCGYNLFKYLFIYLFIHSFILFIYYFHVSYKLYSKYKKETTTIIQK